MGATRALITGGAGFIGSNTGRELLRNGWSVTALDDLSLGKTGNLADGVNFIQGDVADASVWESIPPVDAIIHLAGASSAPMFGDDLIGCFHNNVIGFLRVLEFARTCGARRVAYASTSSVYGNVTPPLREDGPLDVPNFYAVTKHCMEETARVYTQQYGVETIGFRFMSVYGPREDHKRRFANLVSQFIWDAEEDRSPIVYGDGEQTRDFTSVWDIAYAVRLALEHGAPLGAEVFNVGTSEATPVNELVALLAELMRKDVRPHHIPNPVAAGYVRSQMASLEHVERVLGYQPRITLREGVQEILDLRQARG